VATYRKQSLPNYGVFDEIRTFQAGQDACVFEWQGIRFGINICEDIWSPDVPQRTQAAGAEALLVLNASPFHSNKIKERHQIAQDRVRESGIPLFYANLVGGQDELVFDGGSFVVDHQGNLVAQAPLFDETALIVEWADGRIQRHAENDQVPSAPLVPLASFPSEEAAIYTALVTGVRDYVRKNGFPGVLLGLSGGIDSALTLTIAVDALGADKVHAVMMPSQFTANISLEDAEELANNMGVRYDIQPIKRMFDSFMEELADEFENLPFDQTEENIQARIRGVILMALSNKFGSMVLTTGNKSEMACGYATLYGDMAGGLAVLKDVAKTMVWRLSRYRNTIAQVIPERIITRPPSAELRANQCDQDSLPEYETLDAIMAAYVEQALSPKEIVAQGFRTADVERVVSLIDRSEYKRRQSPPGIRITPLSFGRDRRYPITNRYKAPF
jgi:NAD+ synthetase